MLRKVPDRPKNNIRYAHHDDGELVKTKKADKISSVRRKTLPEGRTSSIIYLRIKDFLYGVMQPLELDGTADKRYPHYQKSYPQKDGDHLGTE